MHSLNLTAHSESEKDKEVYEKDGPVNRDVEHLEEGAEQGDKCRACRG